MEIEESMAWGVWQAVPTLDEERKRKAARILSDYRAQQQARGLPLWPTREAERFKLRERARDVVLNPLALDEQNGAYSHADRLSPGLGDKLRKRDAAIAWTATQYDVPEQEVRDRWPAYKADLGRQWGEGVLDDGAFFDRVQKEQQAEDTKLEQFRSDYQAAEQAVLDGTGVVDALQQWQLKNGAERMADSTRFTKAYLAADERLRTKRPIADSLFRNIQANLEMEGPGDLGDAAESAAAIDADISRLALMSPREREDVYALIAAKGRAAGWEQKGFFEQMRGFLLKGSNRLLSTVGASVGALGGTIAQALPEDMRPESADPAAMAQRKREGEVYQELADLASGTLDPVRPTVSWLPELVERGLIQAPGAVAPFMAASALLSTAGALTVFTADFAEQNRRTLRQQGMTDQQARNLGLVAAPFQAAVEQLSNVFQLGRLTRVNAVLSRFSKPIDRFALGRYGRNVALSTATEFTEEELQDNFIVPVVQEIFDALGQDVPEVDWAMYRNKAITEAPELLATLIPMSMLFGGLMTAADVRNSASLVENRDVLQAAGFSEEQAAQVIAAENRVEKARELWPERAGTPTTIEAAMEKVSSDRKAEAERFNAIIAEAERLKFIPAIRGDAQGWTVERDGASVRVSTREEAVAMAYASLDEMERKAAEATAQAAEELMQMGGGRAEAFEISRQNATTETLAENGVLTPEQVAAGVETYAQLHGLTREEAAAEAGRVLGFNRMEQVENVRTAVSRIYGGGNVLTVIEEGVHGRWTAGLERGHYTHQMGITWVRMAEQASGFDFLPSRDDTAITPQVLNEAIAAVVQADLLGRRKDGKQHFTPGLISRGVASFALSGRAQAKQAGRLATFLKSWREFWGQVLRAGRAMAKARREGKLGDDFDVLLDDLLGTEPQQRFEAQAAREAADLAAEVDPDNVPFSLGHVSFSLASPAMLGRIAEIEGDETTAGAIGLDESFHASRDQLLNADPSAARDTRQGRGKAGFYTAPVASETEQYQRQGSPFVHRFDIPAETRVKLLRRPGQIERLTPEQVAEWRAQGFGAVVGRAILGQKAEVVLLNAGQSVADGAAFSLAPRIPQDTEYLAAVEAGDMETAQRMVDQAINDSLPIDFYHGGNAGSRGFIVQFVRGRPDQSYWGGITKDRALWRTKKTRPLSGDMMEFGAEYFNLSLEDADRVMNPPDIVEGAGVWDDPQFVSEFWQRFENDLLRNGDALSVGNGAIAFPGSENIERLSDPVTRDDQGNVIPLSQRFTPSDDIRFSLAPRNLATVHNLSGESQARFSLAPGYGYEHRPREDGPRAFDLAEEDMMPADVYDHPEWYSGMSPKVIQESMAQLRRVRGKPSGKVTIYRAGPKGEMNQGDWVSLSREYARTHAMSQDPGEYKVWSAQVAAADVRWAMDDIAEFGYFGESVPAEDSGVRFSLAPRSLASVADTVLAAQMRKPEFREKYLALARQRLDKLRQDGEWRVDKWGNASRRTGTDTQAERIRTPANIEAERKFRQRSRQRELIDEGMATLTPATLAAYEQGLTTIEDDPLVSAMLGLGHLMSKTEAAKAGKLKTDGKGNAGDYDGAPWLPPSWYAGKGKGYMPDTMAQELHEAGLLKDAYPDTLWEALGRSIGSARAQNEEVRKAQAAVRAIEKNAAEQSRAEAEAWAKEERAKVPSAKDRQMAALRTLDVILSAFPPVVRGRVGGFVKLASLGTDKAREAEILRRLDKLDEVVEDEARKHYAERIDKLFERAKPKKEAGKKPQGKLGPEAQRLVDLALTFSKLTEAEVAAERAAIASRMETATGAEVVDLLEREQVLDLFGAIEQRTAAEMEAAHDWLADTYTAGRNRWRAVVEARAQETEERRAEARKDIGKQGLDAEQQAELERAKKIGSRIKGMAFAWLSFEQVVQSALGRASKLGRDLVRAGRAATNAKTDAMRTKRREFRATMAAIFGTTRQREWQERLWELSQIGGARAVSAVKMEGARVEERTVPVEIVERIIAGEAIAKSYGLDALTVDILEAAWAANEALPANRRKSSLTYSVPMAGKPTPTKLSQLQAVHVTMLARQASYSENMAGHGWTDEVLKEIEAQLTPEAKAIRAWLADQYRGGYDSLNAVYSRMYGVNLPRLTNYAPGTFEARDMMGAEIDPYGQGLLSEGGFRAGMLKTRAQHKARPRLEDALAVYWGHVNATEHFKAFGEFARDLRAVLNEASVRASIKAKGGATLLEAAQKWQEAFERNGLEARSASKAWDEFLRKRQSSQAFLALAYNMGTLMKQSTAALGAMLNMGPTAAARQFGRLLTGQLELGASYRSAVIQRRLDAGYSPEVRQAMAAMMADRPTWASAFLQRGMETIGLVDAVFTTASHAMAWDYHFSEAKAGGLTDAQARQVADLEAEATVARTAQPSEMMDRSLGELGMAPMARFLFMFATEARQKAALALEAYSPSSGLSKGERAMRLLLLHVVFPLAIQTVTNLWRDARDDDDDELFDEDNWRGGDYLKAMLLGPVLGLPLIGGALNAALTPVFGGHYFANDPTQPLNKAATGAGDIFEAIEEGDLETGLKGARSLLWALALAMGGEKSAGLGVGANILYDAFRVGDNSLGEADD
jgi:hypothetical protein